MDISLLVLLALLAIFGWLVVKFGIINIDPQFIGVRRNVVTGKLKELKPGLRFFIPGLYELFQLVDCRQVILDPKILPVTSRDGQPVDVDYQITFLVDGFYLEDVKEKKNGEEKIIHRKGEIKKGQTIKAAITIGEQEGVSELDPQKWLRKNIEVIGEKESNVAIQNMIANYLLEDLISRKEKEKIEPLEITCPNCHKKIPPEKNQCLTPSCSKAEKTVPPGFFERLSWSAGIALNDFLEQKYGLGCYLKIRNVRYPEDTERAARARKIADMEGEATKARLDRETVALKNLIGETKMDPNVAFLGAKASEIIPGLVSALFGKKKEKGEKK